MNREQMVENLYRGVCNVVFEKKDGSMRTMNCTLHPDRLPSTVKSLNEVDGDGGGGNSTPTIQQGTIRVFDTDIQEWRSFRTESVQAFNPPQQLLTED